MTIEQNKKPPKPYRDFIKKIKQGDLDSVRQYIEDNWVDPKHEHSESLRVAAENRHPSIVKYLIPLTNPKDYHSLALRWACEGGCIDCVKLLIPHSNPKDENSSALRLAVMYGHLDVAKFLFPLSEPQKAYMGLLERKRGWKDADKMEQNFLTLWDQQKLKDSISPQPVKKMKVKKI